jgi:hypothetical protein
MLDNTQIIVQVDKTIVKITGVQVRGLDTQALEKILMNKLKSLVRIIGVTGDSIEMDVYGLEESAILSESEDVIKAISMAEGITASDVTKMASVEKIQSFDIEKIPDYIENRCKGERWQKVGQ